MKGSRWGRSNREPVRVINEEGFSREKGLWSVAKEGLPGSRCISSFWGIRYNGKKFAAISSFIR